MLSRRTYAVIYGCSRSAGMSAPETLYQCSIFPNEKPMKDLNPACFVIRGCRLFFLFFLEREQRSIESGQLDRIYSELIPSEMPPPSSSQPCCLYVGYIHTAPSCFSVTNFDTTIPLWTLHTWSWAPVCAQSKQGCLFEKKPCLLYLTLENVSCTRYCFPEPILHSLLFPGKEIWYLRHSSVHLSASTCGYWSCKGYITLLGHICCFWSHVLWCL